MPRYAHCARLILLALTLPTRAADDVPTSDGVATGRGFGSGATVPAVPKESAVTVVIEQLGYERLMMQAFGELPADQALDARQQEKAAACEKDYQAALERFRTTRKAELDAAAADAARNQRDLAAAGGDANPAMMTLRLEPHAPIMKAGCELMRSYRTALGEILTPAQRLAWHRAAVRPLMERQLGGERVPRASQSIFDAAVDEAAAQAAKLPADAGTPQLDKVVTDAFQRHAREIRGLRPR